MDELLLVICIEKHLEFETEFYYRSDSVIWKYTKQEENSTE